MLTNMFTSVLWWCPGAHLFSFLCCRIMYLYLLGSILWCPLRFPHKNLCSVRLYFQLFVWGLMSYLRYLCLFAHSGVQHTYGCVFVFLRLLPVSLDCPLLLPLRYSLKFKYILQTCDIIFRLATGDKSVVFFRYTFCWW